MLLNPVVNQINKYSFLVTDATTQQTYDEAGVDLSTATNVVLSIQKAYNPEVTYEINVSSNLQYILDGGLTVNVNDFDGNLVFGLDHFPDWMYEVTVSYTYQGLRYNKKEVVGFRSTITDIVIQQLQQSDWVKELSCGCEKYSLTIRKFNYLRGLTLASENCLIMQYQEILLALYKLTGTTHEFSS